jgi:hypothetical protein
LAPPEEEKEEQEEQHEQGDHAEKEFVSSHLLILLSGLRLSLSASA